MLNLKLLQISEPKFVTPTKTSLRSNIILVSKYDFTAESSNELHVKKGDILKLLDRPGDGWLLVKFIDKVQNPGLVPATYVDIAINDPQNPVTLSWLQNNKIDLINESNYLDLYCKSAPLTINNKPYPILASIESFLLFNNRYWYRVDVDYSDGTKCYIARYYQDFYNLHLNLLSHTTNVESLKLPKLPEPIPSNSKKSPDTSQEDLEYQNADREDISLLLHRCKELNIYINSLIGHKNFRLSPILLDWFDIHYNSLPGFFESEELSSDQINDKLLPNSINVLQPTKVEVPEPAASPEVNKAVVTNDANEDSYRRPSVEDLPKRSKSKNIFNHYHQAHFYSDRAGQSVSRKGSRGGEGFNKPVSGQSPSAIASSGSFKASTKYPTPQLPKLNTDVKNNSTKNNISPKDNNNIPIKTNNFPIKNNNNNNNINNIKTNFNNTNTPNNTRTNDGAKAFNPYEAANKSKTQGINGATDTSIGLIPYSDLKDTPSTVQPDHQGEGELTSQRQSPTEFQPASVETSFESTTSSTCSPRTPTSKSTQVLPMGTPRTGKQNKPYTPRIHHPSEFAKYSPSNN